MEKQNTMNLEDLYKNPFSDYNANVMEAKTIVNYWCSPFSVFKNFAGLNEKDIYSENNPIVFIGGRGSGKTMFLRYWSFDIQKQIFLEKKSDKHNETLIKILKNLGGIGIYLRIDGPVLRSFEGYGLNQDKWTSIFIHYFELLTARSYLKVLTELEILEELEISNNDKFYKSISKLLGTDSIIYNLKDLLEIIDTRLEEITEYRGKIAFQDCDFKPTKAFASQSLSFKIPGLIKDNIKLFNSNFNFVLLIDEFENFLPDQQRVINTLLKFTKPGIVFRLGMRFEGFRTYATVSDDDFIKEGRDYQKVVFEDILNAKDSGYQEYLKEISRKRLERIPILKESGLTDISGFLGKSENLEEEAIDIVDSKHIKIYQYFSKVISKEDYNKIKHDAHPLVKLLGVLWLIRGLEISTVNQAINDYYSKNKTELYQKFNRDLVDKYKLSLTILLCSIYKKPKSYYSFNTFSYLSSGIVGHFIELCRYCFRYAEFESKEKLVKGSISRELQTKAAREFAIRELQQIKRIEDYGNLLYQMTENLGDIFRKYHLDVYIRYPETNQFALDKSKLKEGSVYLNAFNSALKWSVIQRKPKLQSSSPGEKRTEIYTLNRIFSSEFQISYRTRGGINELYDDNDVKLLMESNNVKPKKDLSKRIDKNIKGLGQQKFEF